MQSRTVVRAVAALVCWVGLVASTARAQGCAQRNVLWLGNSLSYAQGPWFRMLADQIQVPVNLRDQIVGGNTLRQWLQGSALQGHIQSLPSGATWDAVIVQAYSYEPTVTRGDPAAYAANLLTVVQMVRAHSPLAVGVVYETAAYAASHGYYPTWYADPAAMAADVRAGCVLGLHTVQDAEGAAAALLAPVGAAYERDGFQPVLYRNDGIHGDHQGRLLSAMVLFREVYGIDIGSIPVQHGGSSTLEARLTATNISAARFAELAAHADHSGRQLVGSRADLAMAHQADGSPWRTEDSRVIQPGQVLQVRVQSPAGSYGAAPAFAVWHVFGTGNPVASNGFPALHIPPGGATSFTLLGPPGAAGAVWSLPIPSIVPANVSVRVQVAALVGAPCRGNGLFSTTDAVDVVVQ